LRISTVCVAVLFVSAFLTLLTRTAGAQEDTNKKPPSPSGGSGKIRGKSFDTYVTSNDVARAGFTSHIADFVEDQKQIWTSPSRIRLSDANWLVPLGGITAGLFVTDRDYSASLSENPSTLKHYKTVSNIGIAGLIGGGASLYLLSFPAHNDRWRETGFLAGEAALNSLVTVEALKYSLGRERPHQGNGAGNFFRGGTSFPSEHAAAAWSIAGVFAHEYPGTFPKLLAYGMASAVSFSRIHGRQHFPSDVLIGSTLGYLISQNIYRRHHDVEIGGDAWESPSEAARGDKIRSTSFMGSPYVPLDSWIYPAMERLAALGYIRTSILGMRPWTRLECVRLLSEAAERQPDADGPAEVQDLYDSLSREFQSELGLTDDEENRHSQVESVYSRVMGVSGTPLTDNHHFGQSILNDYGRPDRQGFNAISGASGWTTAGPFVIYAQGEYQYSPSSPSLPGAALDFISSIDGLPPNPPAAPMGTVSRFQLLDAYAGMNLANWQISFGKQSLWWGPGEEGAMLFTNNAEPLTKMFRINRVSPVHIPHFADIRLELFIGQVAGYQFINKGAVKNQDAPGLQGQYGQTLAQQPFVSGGKASFKFTPNFEISMSKTTVYGGPGNPLTLNTFVKSTLSMHVNGFQLGDGRAALDFNYRLPKLRDWVSFYGDAFQEDEMSPLNRPYKSAFQTGLYFARIPKVPKLDFRIEGGTTSPVNFPSCNGCYYNNGQYLNGYTNNGVLMGTWLGRASQGEFAHSTYWLSATKRIGIEVRHRKVDRQFLPDGGTQNDIAVNSDFLLKSGFRLTGMLQYERWQIPLLALNRQSDLTASFQIGFWPQARAK
jgi:membrane-associated phospholipid phosphatase